MTKISRTCLISTSAAIAALLTACETTGNPNGGGALFWSPEKAMERRNAMLAEQAARQQSLGQLEQETARYTSERKRLQQEKKRLESRKKAATTVRDKADIDKAIDDIEAELENM